MRKIGIVDGEEKDKWRGKKDVFLLVKGGVGFV
jgi:hypothetical protein